MDCIPEGQPPWNPFRSAVLVFETKEMSETGLFE